jgi:hypothetical protein
MEALKMLVSSVKIEIIIAAAAAAAGIGSGKVYHTFQVWKAAGYSVKKGAKAAFKADIWKHVTKKAADEAGAADEAKKDTAGGYFIVKTAHFFTSDQVEAIKPAKK